MDYLKFVSIAGAQEISADFILPTTAELIAENKRRPNVPDGYLVFALSGAGDAWLISRSLSLDVAFLDHDRELHAKATPMRIDVAQWCELALYMRSHEELRRAATSDTARRRLATAARRFLNSMSTGLARRFPYVLG